MLLFKALHILFMFAAVTLLMGDSLFLALAVRRRDVRALAAFQRLVGARPVLGAGAFGLGIVFGLLTVATGGFDFLEGWLVAAYVLVAVILVLNASPPVQRITRLAREAAEVEAEGRPVEAVIEAMGASRALPWAVAANAALFTALILDMVFKPF
jgi:hypothetical protein